MRFIMDGFFDRAQRPGPITGSGPGYAKAMSQFYGRQRELSKVGVWRKAPAIWKKDDGTYIDPEWILIDYGGEG